MCDACERTIEHAADERAPAATTDEPRLPRRALLRRGLAAGGLLAAGWLLPDLAGDGGRVAAAPGDGGDDDGTAATRVKPSRVAKVATTREVPAVNAGVAAPAIIGRAGWKADESLRVNVREFAPIRKLIVHHSASENRPADPASVVRSTYRYHAVRRGFGDIGYNFMIDHRGRIYEGRFARNYAAGEAITGEDRSGWGVVGAHARTMNHGSCGVCLIGDFEQAAPSDAAIVSLAVLLAWKAGRHRIDVLEDDVYENLYSGFFRFTNVSGHRDVGATLCPGRKLEAKLAAVRATVAGRAGHWPECVVDIPAVVRTERGAPSAAPAATTAPTTVSAAPAAPTAGANATGASVAGYRAATTNGSLMRTAKVKAYGTPRGSVVGLAAPGVGDGYATVSADGTVRAFGSVTAAGATSGAAAAVDLAVAADGAAAWVLRADGSVAAVGAARAFGSPKRSGTGQQGVAIECRPGGDGYWVLTADGAVRGYGNARPLGVAKGSGTPVDVAVAANGTGAYVLFDSGVVVAVGAAEHAGDLTTAGKRWTKPAAAITAVPGAGYVVSGRDGGLFAFGGAPYLGSFAGSQTTVAGIAVACR